MILGLSTPAFTLLHVIISLAGISAGVVVLSALITDRLMAAWIAIFLVATAATSATGFLFHSATIGPPHIVGGLSLVVLAVTALALYGRNLIGIWRPVFVIGSVIALYLNVFVGVVQAFQKIPFLRALAPTQSEPPFAAAQGVVLIAFLGLGYMAVDRFRQRG